MSLFERFRGSRELEEEIVRLRREIRALERSEKGSGAAGPLLGVARALRDARSIESFADAALAAILETAGGESAALVLEGEGGELRAVAARSPSGPLPAASFVVSQGIAAAAARGGQPVATGSAAADTRFKAFQSVQTHAIGSLLCLPVRARTPGCLYLTGGEKGERTLRRADPADLLAIADLVAIALDRLAMDAEISRSERLEAVGLSAASIAHDLKLPLATAQMALAELRDEAPRADAAVASALRALGRAREIAQGLATFARGTESKLEVVPVPLPALLAEHADEVRPLLDAARVAVRSELAHEGAVLGDRSALLRVLGNIAKNAAEAMAEKGGTLVYRTASAGDRVEVSLTDTGPGIPADRIAKVFRPFETSGKPGGCGLGLALARDLVRGMGGDLKAENVAGGGACLRVSLRAAQGDQAQRKPTP